MEKVIIHVDMDAFYASVEQRDNPEYKGKSVIIGGDHGGRGVVSTASYEARKYGVHSAMPTTEARRLCPHGIFLPVQMEKYQQVSSQIMEIFHRYTPLVEPLSLDEAFLDLTGSLRLFGSGAEIATKIKNDIQLELGLTATVGVARNKFLAKLASDLEKPDGLVIINEEDLINRVWKLPIKKLWGIGAKGAEILHKLNIITIGQLAQADVKQLERVLGKVGVDVYWLANGRDDRQVIPSRYAHSIGKERTFAQDISERYSLETVLLDLAQQIGWRLRQGGHKGKTITLKLRYNDFKTITRNYTLAKGIDDEDTIYRHSRQLLEEHYQPGAPVRLIGITISNFQEHQVEQLSLFEPVENEEKRKLTATLDLINQKYGKNTVTRARLME